MLRKKSAKQVSNRMTKPGLAGSEKASWGSEVWVKICSSQPRCHLLDKAFPDQTI